jgi:hypothetical protein
MIREKEAIASPGFFALFVNIVVILATIAGLVWLIRHQTMPLLAIALVLVFISSLVALIGLAVVNPNEAVVLVFFGNYNGTLKKPGLWWVNPFNAKRKLSSRIRNFESAKLKVNDHDGNPIEIAAVVVWRVVDTAEALFEVDNYENFVHVQTESALRNLATSHPYDAHLDDQLSLRGNTADVAEELKKEIQARLEKAGIEVIESRISHLAYAPEIANAMLRRQQASAVIAARTKIVEGAVSMVQMALDELDKRSIMNLDDERKAAMVSNLLVVLCSDRHTQPVVNTGSLYH